MNNEKDNSQQGTNRQRIGVFDGGIGGLLTLSKIRKNVPDATITYIGDCRNLPYNTHTPEWICDKAQKLVDFLQEKKAESVVIACHTVSALVSSLNTYDLNVYDIVTPTLRFIKERKEPQHYLFIGTRTTVDSGCYKPDWLSKEDASYVKAIELATRIEHDGADHPKTIAYIDNLLREHFQNIPAISKPITVVLVCTHYYFVRSHITRSVKELTECPSVEIIEPGLLLANEIPPHSTDEKGTVNLYLNQDKNPVFQEQLDDILDTFGLAEDPVHYMHLR